MRVIHLTSVDGWGPYCGARAGITRQSWKHLKPDERRCKRCYRRVNGMPITARVGESDE